MTWLRILFSVLLIGCSGYTIKIEPVTTQKNKPVKHYHHKTHKSPPPPTPTPMPSSTPEKKPLQLEPTDHPTPMIRLSQKDYVKTIPAMEMYL